MQLAHDYGQPFRLPPPLPGVWHMVGSETAALVAQRLSETIAGFGARKVSAMRARALPFYPDCVLVDLQLYHLDGAGVCGASFVEGFFCLYASEGPLLPPRGGNPHRVRGLFAKLVLDSPQAQEDYLRYALRTTFCEGAPRLVVDPETDLVEIIECGRLPVSSSVLPPPARLATAPGELARFSAMILHRETLSEAEFSVAVAGDLTELRRRPRPGRYALVPDLMFNGALHAARLPPPDPSLLEPEAPGVPWALKLPAIADLAGLLIGWSMEDEPSPTPDGFSTFVPFASPDSGVALPILMTEGTSVMTCAARGAGRRGGCILPALQRHKASVVLLDRMGESIAIGAECRRALGQEVILLDPLGLRTQTGGAFNPLDLFDGDDVEDEITALTLAGTLLPRPESDDARLAHRLLQAILLYIGSRPRGPSRTLSEVMQLAATMRYDPVAVRRLLADAPDRMSQALVADPVTARPENLSPALAELVRALDVLRMPAYLEATRESSFDVAEVRRGRHVTIALVLPAEPDTDTDPAFTAYVRLMVAALLDLFQDLHESPGDASLFLLDEAAFLGDLPGLPAEICRSHETGPRLWTFWKDVAEMRGIHPDHWVEMLASSAAVQSFGPGACPIENISKTSDRAAPDVPALAPQEMFLRLGQKESVIAQRPDQWRDNVLCRARRHNPHARAIDDSEHSETLVTRHYCRSDRTVHLRDGSAPRGGPSRRALPYENAIDEWIRNLLMEALGR